MSVTDQGARDIATAALARIDKHEAVCVENAKAAAEWRAGASQAFQRIESAARTAARDLDGKVGRLYKHLWWAAGGLFGTLVGIIFLLVSLLIRPH